jgi:RNase P subunit RPR2
MENNNNLDGSYISNESLSKPKRKVENNEIGANKRIKIDFHDNEIHVCKTCKATFVNSSNLRHHIESYHVKNNSWSCTQCGKVCNSFLFYYCSNLKTFSI